jgi:uncharacterized protein with HEPN domain
MKKDPLVYIDDIRDSIKAIKLYTAGLTKEDFLKSTEKQDAVCRRIEIIGEAANRLSEEFRNQFPIIPWHKIVGMRNVLIHEYDNIDLDRVWETIRKDIPMLEGYIESIPG